MQYQFNERSEQIKTILFKNSSPLHVNLIRYFKEDGVTGTFTKKEFRYSWDKSTWTNWNTLTQGNLSSIQFRDNPDFYLEVQYSRIGIGSGNILRWYLFYDEIGPTPPSPPDASINADTLQGEPGSYYLDRANHTGPFTGLNVSNVLDGSTAGVYSHRTDSSLGTEFFFKRIKGVGIVVADGPNGIITLTSDASGGGASYENPDPVSETVGGINDGDSFFAGGKTFAETMEAIFYPLSYPALTNPSSTFVENVSYLQKIGNSISIQFTSTFNRGSINPQYDADSPYRSGLGNTVHYGGTGLPSSVGSHPSSPNIQTVNPYVVVSGIQTWTNYWSYDSGVQPYDSKGFPYDASLAAGNTSTDSTSMEGVYPIFATTVSVGTFTEQSLVSMITGNNIELNLAAYPPFQPNAQVFDIPDVWIASRPLQGVETWNTLTSNWEYEGGSASASINNFWVDSSTTHIVNGIVYYTRFSYTGPEADPRGASLIRLKF
jgi:hypothetical protein